MSSLENKKPNGFIWNTLGTIFNSFNSLFFLIIVMRINGIDQAGVFSFSFAITSIFFIIAIYAGRTFQVTEKNKIIKDSDFIASRVISVGGMFFLVAIFLIWNNYDFNMMWVFVLLTLLRALEASSEVFFGVTQKYKRLDLVGKSLFFKSLVSIIVFLLVNLISKNMISAILGLLMVYILFLVFVDIRTAHSFKSLEKFEFKRVFLIFKTGFYTFAFTLLALYVVNAPRFAIENNMPAKYQAIFGILIMPSTIMILFGQFFSQPFLIHLADHFEKKEYASFKKIVRKLNLIIALLGAIALILAYFLGIPVLQYIYGTELEGNEFNLVLIILGAIFYTISVIFSNALITMRVTKAQLGIYIISALCIFILSEQLVAAFNLLGGVLSYTIVMLLQLVLYYITYKIVFIKLLSKAEMSRETL